MSVLLVVGTLAAPLPGRADTFQAVALSATSEDEARGRLTELVDVRLYARVVGFPNELPKVFAPNTLPGSPKGKWLVVLSICAQKKGDAKKLAAAIRDRARDATSFVVKGAYPEMCLPKRALETFSDEESKLIQAVLKEPHRAKPRNGYASFLQSKGRLSESEAQLKKSLELEPDDFEARNLLQVIQVMRQP